jgi:outer membrane lipoprotein-sorting protein
MLNLLTVMSLTSLIAHTPLTAAYQQPAALPQPAVSQPAASITGRERSALLADASRALSAVRTARGRFEQIGPDGSFSEGQFALSRPGRVRFDYADPSPLLFVSDGTTVALQDRDLETTDRVPLRSTPLSLLLAEAVDFEGQAEILDVSRQNGLVSITLRDRTGEMDGTLTVLLSEADKSLRGWNTVDSNQGLTTVRLIDVQSGVRLNPRLFILRDLDNR